jgi:hypothetical protein
MQRCARAVVRRRTRPVTAVRRPARPLAAALAALAIVALVAACGGGSAGTPGPQVTVDPLIAAVSAGAPSGQPTPLSKRTSVPVGEVVRTDHTGLAELVFPDGSLSRVAADAQIVVSGLGPQTDQRVHQKLDNGSSWHRVRKLTGTGSAFEVETPVGTAAVRGTAFAVTCPSPSSCSITVVRGTVVFSPVGGGAAITITAFQRLVVPGSAVPVTLPAAAVLDDPWIADNLRRDGTRIDDPAPAALATTDGPVSDPHTLVVAGLDGSYSSVVTLTSAKGGITLSRAGMSMQSDWTIGGTTCPDTTCQAMLTAAFGHFGAPGRTAPETDPITFADGHLVIHYHPSMSCNRAGTSTPVGSQQVTYDLQITKAEVRAGRPVATQLTGTFTSHGVIGPEAAAAGCTPGTSDLTGRVVVTRV